jgi:hypothetical protein
MERGNAALVASNIWFAAGHFERSSRYFSGAERTIDAAERSAGFGGPTCCRRANIPSEHPHQWEEIQEQLARCGR